MATTYEFVVETLDENVEIIDTSAFDTLAEATVFANSCDEPWRIALRRDTGNDTEGLTDRGYAYPNANGKLPERFETSDGAQDGASVPKRFRDMIFPTGRNTSMTNRISNAHLSDLFFNYRHEKRDEYYRHTKPDERDEESERAALHDDATEFSDMINGATGNMFITITPNDYVNDFFARL